MPEKAGAGGGTVFELTAEDSRQIETVHDRWIEYEKDGDTLAVLDLCTDDIKWLAPDAPVLAGKAAIRKWLESAQVELKELHITERTIRGLGSIAWLTSRFSATYRVDGESEDEKSTGVHLWVFQKFPDGAWRVAMVTWRLSENGSQLGITPLTESGGSNNQQRTANNNDLD